jgi:hypothetical protein
MNKKTDITMNSQSIELSNSDLAKVCALDGLGYTISTATLDAPNQTLTLLWQKKMVNP